MSSDRVKIVVWDSIGNTLLGVRPWASWEPGIQALLRREDPAAEAHAPSFAELFAGYDVDLIWFNSGQVKIETFGQLYRDYAPNLRFVTSLDELVAEIDG